MPKGRLVEPTRVPEPPPGWTGTKPEWYVNWALTRLKAQFQYQSPELGGRIELGGAVLDFLVFLPTYVGLRIQGLYWHYGRGSDTLARNKLQRIQLEAQGIPVVDLDEDMVLANPVFYVREALRYRDYSRLARGFV